MRFQKDPDTCGRGLNVLSSLVLSEVSNLAEMCW